MTQLRDLGESITLNGRLFLPADRLAALLDVADAAQAVVPYLRASNDNSEAIQAVLRSPSDSLRFAADNIERKDAAIYALRDTLAALKEAK